jgi:hypothetical protein
MDSQTVDDIKSALNSDVVRKLLINYFIAKGYETPSSFDKQICPCVVQDLPVLIPMLQEKIEIIPNISELNNITSRAELEWNLFVLGWHRMFLGNTFHNDLKELATQIRNGVIMSNESRRQSTPRRIVHFIMRSLSDKQSGYVNLALPSNTPPAMGTPSNGNVFFRKPRLI